MLIYQKASKKPMASAQTAIRGTVRRSAARREEFRNRLLSEKEARIADLLARIGGRNIYGMDEHGRPAETKPPHRLKARITSTGRAEISFSKESWRRVARILPETLERKIRGGEKAPRKRMTLSTDLLHAVRCLKHTREGHRKEIERKEEIISDVNWVNAQLGSLGASAPKKKLEEFRKRLLRITDALKNNKLLLKRAALHKLKEAVECLKKAKGAHSSQAKYRHIFSAAMKLSAFENRLGMWRDEEIIGIDFYNLLRERALRLARDDFLRQELNRYARIFGNRRSAERWLNFYRHDMEVIRLIQSIGNEIKQGEWAEQPAKAIEGLLNDLGRPGSLTLLEVIGREVAAGPDYIALRELRDAYRALRDGDMEKARFHLGKAREFYYDRLSHLAKEMHGERGKWLVARQLEMAHAHIKTRRPRKKEALSHLEKAVRFIRMNKLDYFAEELAETGDSYTTAACRLIREAHEHFKNGEFQLARERCLEASKELLSFRPK